MLTARRSRLPIEMEMEMKIYACCKMPSSRLRYHGYRRGGLVYASLEKSSFGPAVQARWYGWALWTLVSISCRYARHHWHPDYANLKTRTYDCNQPLWPNNQDKFARSLGLCSLLFRVGIALAGTVHAEPSFFTVSIILAASDVYTLYTTCMRPLNLRAVSEL